MQAPNRLAVVGGGIVGMAIASELLSRFPGSDLVVFEKEDALAAHQTGHNSGVVHAGLYYEPGSLKARLCRRGSQLMSEYAAAKEIPYDRCGKVVVALDPEELPRLRAIFARSTANLVPDVALVGADQLREIEPNAVGVGALHSPETAIIDYRRVTEQLAVDVQRDGGQVLLSTEVINIEESLGKIRLETTSGDMTFDSVIVCGGLQSDRIAVLAGAARSPVIVPFIGQYLQLDPQFRSVTNGLVYPVPDPRYPFLGVHLTKRIDGEIMIGPNAFLALDREQYEGIGINGRDLFDIVREPGFWRFACQNVTAAIHELQGVLSHRRFMSEAARYVPAIESALTTPVPRGIRAQAISRNGQLVDDFVIERRGALILLRNAPSPGATASLAIAEHIVSSVFG